MKKLIYAALAAFLTVGCSDKKPTLYVYNWADYMDPEVVSQFEQENNCHVSLDQFDDNEAMIAKLLAGASGYDVIFPSSYVIPLLQQNDLIQRLDLSKLPNVKDQFDPKYKKLLISDTMEWSVPYAFSMTGLTYRESKPPLDCKPDTWQMVFDRQFTGRICILNDVREIIGIGLKINGHSVNSTNAVEIAEAAKTMIRFKQRAKKLDNVQYKSGIINAEFSLAMGYNSDVLQINGEDPASGIKFVVPKEGTTCCFDEMCITKNAKTELAYKFIDFLYQPEVAAKNAKYNCTNVPNKGMAEHLSESDKSLLDLSEDVLARVELVRDVGPALELYNKAWDQFKSAR